MIGRIDHSWTGSISEALNANFIRPDGTSRPGTHWRVDLEHCERKYTTLVLTYRGDDIPPGVRPDVESQARAVLRYVFERLGQGWTPGQDELPPITLSDSDI